MLRGVGTLPSKSLAVARGATLRRHLVNVPARFTPPKGPTPPAATHPHAPRRIVEQAVAQHFHTQHRCEVAA